MLFSGTSFVRSSGFFTYTFKIKIAAQHPWEDLMRILTNPLIKPGTGSPEMHLIKMFTHQTCCFVSATAAR